ncbi:hypothetical protein PLICRDRAFT_305206 [Plicaturopsis crispa FD-325 SS-3]|nr:hypothetical protein PLICRDRAFT_305206 [Plicaturopsis crispa FD-325 SS-3]
MLESSQKLTSWWTLASSYRWAAARRATACRRRALLCLQGRSYRCPEPWMTATASNYKPFACGGLSCCLCPEGVRMRGAPRSSADTHKLALCALRRAAAVRACPTCQRRHHVWAPRTLE